MNSLGQQMREVRLSKGLSEEAVSEEICIPASTVRALESDDYGHFDSVIYAKSFLSKYSKFLELDVSNFLSRFDSLSTDDPSGIFASTQKPLDDTAPDKPTVQSRSPLFLAPVLFGILGFLCFSLFCLFTDGSLPFAPNQASASEPEASPSDSAPQHAAAAMKATETDAEDSSEELQPMGDEVPISEVSTEDHSGYIKDFQADNTTYLPAVAP